MVLIRLNILNVNTGEIKEESQKEMVLTAFRNLKEGTDWDIKEKIEELYNIEIDERNWVSARRGDLIAEGLIENTGRSRKGDFGKSCAVWCYNPDGKKYDSDFLSSNQMNRIVKYLNDKCRTANLFQIKQMKEVLIHYENLKR